MPHVLVNIGKKRFIQSKNSNTIVPFTGDATIDAFLNDLGKTPHAFFLACLMDKQIKADRAWKIPFQVKEIVGGFDISQLAKISQKDYYDIFQQNQLHRFNNIMAEVFYFAVQRIATTYGGDVSAIWKGNPSSAKVVYEFLQFKGSGVKISTMAANILARDFHVPFSDYCSIDISTDVHIMRIMRRTGLIEAGGNRDCAIYKARELCPDFPGVIDYTCWEVGKKWCKPKNPDCTNCIISNACKKLLP